MVIIQFSYTQIYYLSLRLIFYKGFQIVSMAQSNVCVCGWICVYIRNTMCRLCYFQTSHMLTLSIAIFLSMTHFSYT